MAELAGKDVVIKISGAATPMVGEATTSEAGNLLYRITDASKQVLEMDGVISVHKKGANDAAEALTTTTTLKMTAHGLVVGDLICNTTRANAYRLVLTVPDANTITVAAIAAQAAGDVIETYKTEPASAYTLNRLNGLVTYPDALVRVIKISGNYLPMSTAAYANNMSRNKQCDLLDAQRFGLTHKSRIPGLLSASGTLNNIDLADPIYGDALTAGAPIVIEDRYNAGAEPNRFWALLEADEIASAVEGLTEETVTWTSKNEWLTLGS